MPRKGSTAGRGYGGRHQAKRAKWAPKVKTGTIPCARCGHLINPNEPWDLGHIDGTTGTPNPQWAGPEHRACNRATAGRRTPRPQPGPRPPALAFFDKPTPPTGLGA